MSVIIVAIKADGPEGGSAKVCCASMGPDPLNPDTHVVLKGVRGLSWPFSGAWMDVQQWSIPKDVILNWMSGPLRTQPSLTVEKLREKGQNTPHLPDTKPSMDMDNDRIEIQELLNEEEIQAQLEAQAREAMAKRAGAGEADGS